MSKKQSKKYIRQSKKQRKHLQKLKKQLQRNQKIAQKKKKKQQRLKNKQILQLAKQLKRNHLNQKQKVGKNLRDIVPHTNKSGIVTNIYFPPFQLQAFKSPQGWWRPVKTCRLQSLSDRIFNIIKYNQEKDYFVLSCHQQTGTFYYSRDQLQPILRKTKATMQQFIKQAEKAVIRQKLRNQREEQ